MPLGTEVNVGAGDVVLDGVADTPKRAPSFRFMSIVASDVVVITFMNDNHSMTWSVLV